MAKYLIAAILALASTVTADDAGAYAAPSGGYAAPTGGYAAPSGGYAPPSTGYGVSDNYAAPETSYQSTGYEAPSSQYGVIEENPFDLSKILELLPLFLAVFAAIIVAQLFAPLIGALFGLKLGLAGTILGPLGTAKIDLINFVLGGFGLSLCTLTPLAVATGRDMPSGFSLNPDIVDNVAKMLYNSVQAYTQEDA